MKLFGNGMHGLKLFENGMHSLSEFKILKYYTPISSD
jgi:hypothetical protein